MGVYIDMEMLKSCPCKLIGIGYDMYCSFVHGIPARAKEYDECCEKGTRPNWCPVIPIPEPHGRLIDADKLMKRMWDETDCMISVPATFVRDAPTVIPASEEVST